MSVHVGAAATLFVHDTNSGKPQPPLSVAHSLMSMQPVSPVPVYPVGHGPQLAPSAPAVHVVSASQPPLFVAHGLTFASANPTNCVPPRIDACTSNAPAPPNAAAVIAARPFASVVAVAAESTAVAPVSGARKLTSTSGTGLLPASRTSTTRACAKDAPKSAAWPLPEMSVMLTGSPGVLVSVNVTGAVYLTGALPYAAIALIW